MRFDGKSTGLFSDEEPKKKRKKRIKITEDQYNRLFNLNEEDEASTDSGSSSGGGSPQISEFALLNNFMRNKLLLDLAYL